MAAVLDHPSNPKNESPLAAREAPHNMEAEQAVLGAILANNEALNHVGSALEPEDFYAGVHQRLFKVIKQFNDKGLIANAVTLKHHFMGAEGVEEVGVAVRGSPFWTFLGTLPREGGGGVTLPASGSASSASDSSDRILTSPPPVNLRPGASAATV